MKTYRYQVTYTTAATAMKDNGDGTCLVVPSTQETTKQYFKKADAYTDIRRLLGECGELFLKATLNPVGSHCPEVYDNTNWQEAKITRG